MAVVARTIHAFSFDENGKDSVKVQAGTKVHAKQQVGPNFICSVGVPGLMTYLVIPASDLLFIAEKENDAEPSELSLGERGEPTREEIEEPEVWGKLSVEDEEDLEDVALHKEHLDVDEFKTYISNKVSSLDSSLLQRLHQMVSKQNPELSDDEINSRVQDSYEKHADQTFLRSLKKEVESEDRPEQEGKLAAPPAGKTKAPLKPEDLKFEVPPEVLRAAPGVAKGKFGQKPFGNIPIPGQERRFVVTQIDPAYPMMGLMDTKTKYYEVFGGPDVASAKAFQIVQDEEEEKNNPMPTNKKSGMSEITHEGFIIQRKKDDKSKTMEYVFFSPRNRKQTNPGGNTLKETKEMVDTHVLGKAGLKEEPVAVT